jgi:hypothetical protein
MKKSKNLKPEYLTTVSVFNGASWRDLPMKSISLVSSCDLTSEGTTTNREKSVQIKLNSPVVASTDVPTIQKIRRKIVNLENQKSMEDEFTAQGEVSVIENGTTLYVRLADDTKFPTDYGVLVG